jgi:glutamate racemase
VCYEKAIKLFYGKTTMTDHKPIAVLDTGAGGLSVVAALRHLAPMERICYFADTAHLPYGLKSPELIKFLGLRAAKTLVELTKPKILVIACHTISVWCLDILASELDIPVIGMLKPSINGLKKLIAHNSYETLGLISTKATVNSGAFRSSWAIIDPENKTKLIEHACGPLVSLVEEGMLGQQELQIILDGLLPQNIKSVDALLIGCTHFSALVPVIRKILKPQAHIIDAADLVACEAVARLSETKKLAAKENGFIQTFVSDNPERFLSVATKFTSEAINIELIRGNYE